MRCDRISNRVGSVGSVRNPILPKTLSESIDSPGRFAHIVSIGRLKNRTMLFGRRAKVPIDWTGRLGAKPDHHTAEIDRRSAFVRLPIVRVIAE